jgi:PEP-CTERM motif
MGPAAADTDLGDVAIVPEPATIPDSSADTDGIGDGIIDAVDYTVWPWYLKILPFVPPPKPPYVASSGGTSSPAAAPEPSSLMLLAVGSLFVWQIRLLRSEG